MIEALRSGVPSRTVGEYFSEARPAMLKRISDKLDAVREGHGSEGFLYTGRYGEGKTHLLNTVFSMASSSQMVVSYVSLGKETPVDKPWILYKKIIANTYLPGARQPGFLHRFEALPANGSIIGEMLAYSAKELETDKLYYLLRAYFGTQDEEDKYILLSDLAGSFCSTPQIKKSYRAATGQSAKFNQNFSKTKHAMDYFHFMSHLFRQMGYQGWVLLFDEAELLGRLGKKTRLKSYQMMDLFLEPSAKLESVFSLFAISSSYVEEVIDKKQEFANLEETFPEDPEHIAIANVLNLMIKAPELVPLTKDEIRQILMQIQEFHGKAYDWNPNVSTDTLYKATEAGGYLLRTKIRAAIEFLDQLYQYGEAGDTRINALGEESYTEDESSGTPSLDALL